MNNTIDMGTTNTLEELKDMEALARTIWESNKDRCHEKEKIEDLYNSLLGMFKDQRELTYSAGVHPIAMFLVRMEMPQIVKAVSGFVSTIFMSRLAYDSKNE